MTGYSVILTWKGSKMKKILMFMIATILFSIPSYAANITDKNLIKQVQSVPKRAIRPKNSGMVVSKLEKTFGVVFLPIKENFKWLMSQLSPHK